MARWPPAALRLAEERAPITDGLGHSSRSDCHWPELDHVPIPHCPNGGHELWLVWESTSPQTHELRMGFAKGKEETSYQKEGEWKLGA